MIISPATLDRLLEDTQQVPIPTPIIQWIDRFTVRDSQDASEDWSRDRKITWLLLNGMMDKVGWLAPDAEWPPALATAASEFYSNASLEQRIVHSLYLYLSQLGAYPDTPRNASISEMLHDVIGGIHDLQKRAGALEDPLG